jgi:hypothetical protein
MTVPFGAELEESFTTSTKTKRPESSPAAVGVLTPMRSGSVTDTVGQGMLWVVVPLMTNSGRHATEEGAVPKGT